MTPDAPNTGLTFVRIAPLQHDPFPQLLAAHGLASTDLDGPDRSFWCLDDHDEVVGYVGVEGVGTDRLLRSLVVTNERRGEGHGRELVHRVEHIAKTTGTRRLHLLTITAAAFFRSCGYVDASRPEAPPEIRTTAQFGQLCPASATYLVKELA